MKLGRLPHSESRLAAVPRYGALAPLPDPPTIIDWNREIAPGSWGAYGNLTIGDCTAAGAAHAIEGWGFTCPPSRMLPEADCIALYSAVSGYDPTRPETDRGALCLDVLDHWHRTPVGGVPLAGYVAIDPRNHRHVRQAVWLFGGVYAGVTLKVAQQTQAVWDAGGDPAIWGGHCIWIAAADDDGMTCVTWGETRRLTWRWWDGAADEAYGLVSPLWRSPIGIATETLVADLARIGG